MQLSRPAALVAGATTLALTLLSTGDPAVADDSALEPHHTFTMAINAATGSVASPAAGADIPNVDSTKSTIRKYYNAGAGTLPDGTPVSNGIANKDSSPYITEVEGIEQHLLDSLRSTARPGQVVVFDADDTLLWNYDFEDAATNFVFDPAKQQPWVDQGWFPAVPGMVDTVQEILSRGYGLYVITGRPASQEDATIANLTDDGYVDGQGDPIFDNANVFTKYNTAAEKPDYIAECTPAGSRCTTVQYKAQTRQHIEDSTTSTIVANVGDQWSDLWGGYSDTATKIPNPTYFLASPDLANPPARDAGMVPPSTYTMLPDGSSGLTQPGDGIPNIDLVRSEVRAYYGAGPGTLPDGTPVSNGIANKSASPYISEMTDSTATWADQVGTECADAVTAHDDAAADLADATAALQDAQDTLAADQGTLQSAKNSLESARAQLAAAKERLAQADTPKQRQRARAAVRHWRHVVAHRKVTVDAAREQVASDKQDVADAQAAVDAITVPDLPAAVFDADDTTLWTYDMEDGDMKFVFNPTRQNEWVTNKWFPAVPGMVDVVKAADAAGCTIIGLTGRGTSQQAATVANLADDGYVDGTGDPLFLSSNYFTKPPFDQTPSYIDCTVDGNPNACSTIEYKSQTRKHVENDLHLDIVANFGDQFSDLKGGYADTTYKLPNPTYYLP